VTLYGYGTQLLTGSGTYSYNYGPMRQYFRGRAAQNVVDIAGAKYTESAPPQFLAAVHNTRYDLVTVRDTGYAGATLTRTILYSRTGGYLVVDDRLTQSTARRAFQRWYLDAGRTTASSKSLVNTAGEGGNLSMFWIGAAPTHHVVRGSNAPLVGWRSFSHLQLVAVPTVEAWATDKTVRFTTVLIPRPATMSPGRLRVRSAKVSPNAANALVTIAGLTEKFAITATTARVTPQP
jgi:hypothetical protein